MIIQSLSRLNKFRTKCPLLTASIIGALYGLAFFPHPLAPLFVLALGALYAHLDAAPSIIQAFSRLFAFGISFICVSMYWVGYAFSAIQMGYVGPIAVLGLSILLTLFMLPIVLIVYFAPIQLRRLAFIIGFAGCEWLRGNLFTGLPWNLAAHTWGMWPFGLSISQSVSFMGIYGLSAITIVVAVFLCHPFKTVRTKLLGRGFLVLVLAALAIWGQWRLNQNPTQFYEKPIYMRLIQPCIDPGKKWHIGHLKDILLKQMALSDLEADRPLAAIIWPEAAVPLALNREPYLRQELSHVIPTGGVLITGSIIREGRKMPNDKDEMPNLPDDHRYSALVVLDEKGAIIARHKKSHLLPFGEYAPFRDWLPIDKFTPGTIDYSEGTGIKTLVTPQLPPFAPLICFEAVFPGQVTEKNVDSKKPIPAKWLLNITNDAWYQRSVGLKQHLANVRFRAIEEGLPMVRVANNGISAVIDSVGRILHHLDIDDIGFIDFELPMPLRAFIQRH